MFSLTVVASKCTPNGDRVNVTQKRRNLEKARIQKLKQWHENVKSIAKSEIDFIQRIFKDETPEDRDWVLDEESSSATENSGAMVKKDP